MNMDKNVFVILIFFSFTLIFIGEGKLHPSTTALHWYGLFLWRSFLFKT